jgi:hypothetical protein
MAQRLMALVRDEVAETSKPGYTEQIMRRLKKGHWDT